ncbi:MAG: hypothetical protein M1438_21065, partial [Deltaproteobacteria bacterium]|nr:hypothetical protein [Deltaproteobacteria bacterium]
NLLIEVHCLKDYIQPVTRLPHQLLADRVSPPKKLIHTISLNFNDRYQMLFPLSYKERDISLALP